LNINILKTKWIRRFTLTEHMYITHTSPRMSRVLKLASGTNEIIKDRNKKLHAEQNVLLKSMRQKIKYSRKGYDIYSLRIFRSGRFANAKPCAMCVMRMDKSRLDIRNIYYSNKKGNIIKIAFSDLVNENLAHSRGTR